LTEQSTTRAAVVSTQAAQNNTLSVHVGGGAIGAFISDADGTGGTISTTSSPINVSAANAAPAGLYQAQRYGPMTYTVPGFTPSAAYTVRLHFAEQYFGANGRAGGVGSRKFNVAINGKTVLSNYDVYAAAGAANKAVVVDEPSTADASGTFTIAVTNGSANNAILNGVQILPAAALNDVQAANIGGGAIGVFAADTLPNGGTNGTITTTTAAINVSAANAAPSLVYQSQRYGPMQRAFTGLTPSAAYTVRLHFAELYWGTAGHPGTGQREFNVAINGTSVLTNFDVYAAAGAADTAVVRDFSATADGTGAITVALTNGLHDNAMLSGVEILGLTAAPAPITVGSETPHASDSFVDSIGVNTHLAYFSSYYANFSQIKSLLQTAGIRHIRDGTPAGNVSLCSEEATLGAAGIHMNMLTDGVEADAASGAACLGSTVESLESMNEPDLNQGSNWVSVVQANSAALAAGLPTLPLLAPAVTSMAAEQALGPMPNISFGNVHAYFAGRNPGTPGWGDATPYGTYGSMAYVLGIAGIVSGSDPIKITESGYSDAVDQYAVPALTKARYLMRTTLEAFNAGVPRTFLYELVDEGPTQFSHYGIVDSSGNPKLAYTGLHNLIATLADPGAAFTMTPLNYNFAAAPSVHHTLLERRNGTYELIIWNEIPEWDPNANATIATTPAPVDLTFATPPSSITATTFADTGTVTTSTVTSGQIVTLSASNWPTIVEIKP
jgi:hypothetical protein